MKKVTIEISDSDYEKIQTLVNWFNMDNVLEGNNNQYTIEDFISGSAIYRMEEMLNLIPLSKNNIDIRMPFQNCFKEIAASRKIKQIDIANKLGMHKSNLSVIFNNKEQPRSDTFFRIWALLECPPIHKCIQFKD